MKIQDSKSSNLTLNTSLFEELSEVELEAVSGGGNNKQDGLVNVSVQDVQIVVAAQALANESVQTVMTRM
jgi:bacteriocin-like protein